MHACFLQTGVQYIIHERACVHAWVATNDSLGWYGAVAPCVTVTVFHAEAHCSVTIKTSYTDSLQA